MNILYYYKLKTFTTEKPVQGIMKFKAHPNFCHPLPDHRASNTDRCRRQSPEVEEPPRRPDWLAQRSRACEWRRSRRIDMDETGQTLKRGCSDWAKIGFRSSWGCCSEVLAACLDRLVGLCLWRLQMDTALSPGNSKIEKIWIVRNRDKKIHYKFYMNKIW